MSDWYPCAGATVMREQFDERWPNRDKRTDGIVGDSAHAARVSDHNPKKTPPNKGVVRALDIDHNFGRPSDPELFVAQLLDYCLNNEPGSKRIKYVVYKDQVASATYADTLWVMRGSGYGHWEHIHISFTDVGLEDDRPFDLPIFDKPLWDGHVPDIEAVRWGRRNDIANAATFRVAARLDDLGYYDNLPLPRYKQRYPVKAIQKFQRAMGGPGLGNYTDRTHELLFGV